MYSVRRSEKSTVPATHVALRPRRTADAADLEQPQHVESRPVVDGGALDDRHGPIDRIRRGQVTGPEELSTVGQNGEIGMRATVVDEPEKAQHAAPCGARLAQVGRRRVRPH